MAPPARSGVTLRVGRGRSGRSGSSGGEAPRADLPWARAALSRAQAALIWGMAGLDIGFGQITNAPK